MEEYLLTLESVIAISEDVVSCDLEGEAVLLNLDSGTYFGLDEVGTRIWSLIQEYGSLHQVFDSMQGEYEVVPHQLQTDILQLVGKLLANGLVRVAQPQ